VRVERQRNKLTSLGLARCNIGPTGAAEIAEYVSGSAVLKTPSTSAATRSTTRAPLRLPRRYVAIRVLTTTSTSAITTSAPRAPRRLARLSR